MNVSNLQKLNGTLAQLVEQRTFNPFVVGSTPAGPTKFKPRKRHVYGVFSLVSASKCDLFSDYLVYVMRVVTTL